MSFLRFEIDGVPSGNPRNWQDIEIVKSYFNGSGQPFISTSEFIFVNTNEFKDASRIYQHEADGLNGGVGVTEGLPVTINVVNPITAYTPFNGFIDFFDDYKKLSPVEVSVKLKAFDSLNTIDVRSRGISMRSLFDQGVFNQSDFIDIPYVKEKPFNFIEFALLSITIFLLAKQLAEIVKQLTEYIIEFVETATSGAFASVAAAIGLAAKIVVYTAFAAILTIQLIELTKQLIENLIAPVRYHKGILLKTILEKGFAFMGYEYSSSITELENLAILPTQREQGSLNPGQSGYGLPKEVDFGFYFSEIIKLQDQLWDARVKATDNSVQIESLSNESFWTTTSNYNFPSVLIEQSEFYSNGVESLNLNELQSNRLTSFQSDPMDLWTVLNFTGTTTQVITSQIDVQNPKAVGIKGLEQNSIPYGLGNRKNGLTTLEKAIKGVAQAADAVVEAFGGNSDLAAGISNRTGMLRMETDEVRVPRLMPVDSQGKLPSNFRDTFNSEVITRKYHKAKSFVEDNYFGQWRTFTEARIPFGFNEDQQTSNNSYFTLPDGRIGKFDEINWKQAKDSAVVNYRIREPYQKNLKETYITP